ncbi:hypothetical protein Actkin_02947 [Actinokineospora sp. UTMC 2448]|nr:hypothetical protein Actkin_02947 [Actinokineospora sp. UTMC 2448]
MLAALLDLALVLLVMAALVITCAALIPPRPFH